jgi:hypothetical protein
MSSGQSDPALEIILDMQAPLADRMKALLHYTKFCESPPATELLNILMAVACAPDEPEDLRYSILLALGKLMQRFQHQLDDIAFTFLAQISQHSSPGLASHACEALGLSHDDRAIDVLIHALEHPENEVFSKAAEALGDLGAMAVKPLITLLNAPRKDIQCAAAWQLGQLQALESLGPLVEKLQQVMPLNEDPDDLSPLCIWALGEIGQQTPLVLAILLEAKGHPNPNIHQRATLALKKISRHIN